ncbi:RNA repair transcriptional activator RtcR family protein [Fodinibius halophilus]|uniref:Sigma 54-interacting transcriptional regulator n=1 Tax=Fodinibius halophilus TaxID=1736908 RepID=A0A6M1TCG5_9BACT|nr:sigma-54 dependent transcriptional regulator [Fodinibius halophilus]NGP89691.1 sigma 54-interacting transcriptional regulator [Fodinibius halophilus]
MKIIISWLAYNNDFQNGTVDESGPTYNFHNYFFNEAQYDKHILLATETPENLRITKLENKLKRDFPKHNIECKTVSIEDPIDLREVKTKVEPILLDLSDCEIDIFFSPGTSIMQVAWYICHTSLGLNSRLIQVRPAKHSQSNKPERLIIDVNTSEIPKGVILKQKNSESDTYEHTENYLITDSIQPVYDNAFKVAQTDNVTTLIQAETGTGKEHLARFIHENSVRSNQPYIPINCSAFSDDLLESRLFGHKKGAFTGATKDKEGIFKKTDGGTVFLDEIGDISSYMQQALLRVLEEKEITPVGGTPEKIDVRIITASNKNLVQLCKDDKFRWDLFYRLNVAPLELPSLQERGKGEVEKMIDFFIDQKQKTLKKSAKLEFSKEAKKVLVNYGYPGNIRELENLIERLYVFAEEEVMANDIPNFIKKNDNKKSLSLADLEKRHIEYVMDLYNGNQSKSAEALGIVVNTLKNKMEKYGLKRQDFVK